MVYSSGVPRKKKLAKLVVPYHPRPGACARPRVLAELLDSSKPAETLEIRKVQVGSSGNMVLHNQMDYKRRYQGFIMDYQSFPTYECCPLDTRHTQVGTTFGDHYQIITKQYRDKGMARQPCQSYYEWAVPGIGSVLDAYPFLFEGLKAPKSSYNILHPSVFTC